jgi:hypothetical protein
VFKFFIASFFVLVVTAPALAKSKDVYPVSCDDLWAAVKDSLQSPRDYAILSMNEAEQRASFTIIGNLVVFTQKVALTARDGGCAMKATFIQIGPDDSDWRQFHHRLERSLAKLQAAKPKPAEPSAGQE